MHSDARALPIRRVTRSGCGIENPGFSPGCSASAKRLPTRRLNLCQHGARSHDAAPNAASAMLLAHFCQGFQLVQRLPALRREHSVDTAILRTTAVQCTEPYVPYVPSREPYVPSWSQGGSAKENIYAEQRTEYEEYAKVLQAGGAGASGESEDSPLAPPSLEVIEGALRAALAPVHLRCGEQGPSGRPLLASLSSPGQPRLAEPRSCFGPPLAQFWPNLGAPCLAHRCTTWL